MTRARSTSGRRAQDAGALFERDLDAAHRVYRDFGVAVVQRLPVPTSPLPTSALGESGRRQFAGRARVLARRQGYDYFGVMGLKAGPAPEDPARWAGLAVAMEAKATAGRDGSEKSLPIVPEGAKGSGVQEHQLGALAAVAEVGGVAALVWRDGHTNDDTCFRGVLLPDAMLRVWADFQGGGRRSVPREAFTPYTVFEGFEDWLFEVRAWMELTRPPRSGVSTETKGGG